MVVQQKAIKGDSDGNVLTIPLDLAGSVVHFKHRLPAAEETASPINILKNDLSTDKVVL
jgi:hypothetical protein